MSDTVPVYLFSGTVAAVTVERHGSRRTPDGYSLKIDLRNGNEPMLVGPFSVPLVRIMVNARELAGGLPQAVTL